MGICVSQKLAQVKAAELAQTSKSQDTLQVRLNQTIFMSVKTFLCNVQGK